MFSTPREIAESSSRRRSSRPKAERSKSKATRSRDDDETADERDARREERRIKKLEKDARRAAEAEALLRISRVKRSDKRGEISSSSSSSKKEKKLYVDDIMSGLHARPSRERRSGSPKQREVRPIHLTHLSRSRYISLNNLKDSSASPRKSGSEHHRHHRHEHSSAESALSCGRCLKKQRKRDERAALEAGREEKAARLERSERAPSPERVPAPERVSRRKLRPEGRTQATTINTTGSTNSTNTPAIITTSTTTTAAATSTTTERRPRTRSVPRAVSPSSPPRRRRGAEKPVETKERRRKMDRAEAEPRIETVSVRQPMEGASRQVAKTSSTRPAVLENRTLSHREPSHREPTLRPSEKPPRRLSEGASARRGSRSGPSSSHGGRAPPPPPPTPPPDEGARPILGFDLEDKSERPIKCVTCLDDEIPAKDAAKLACGHWFCNECLKRLFTLSLTDPAHMPPKCCASDHIPLKHVANLLSFQNKKLWNQKYLEYTTANRIYCPTTDCGEWIQPKDIQNGIGRCQKCRKEVCSTCNGRAHGDGACPQDPDMIKFFETAEKNKYQKCHNCKAMVELERGCNHMTCHCRAQFCYVCGSKWKTCGCPWFNEPDEAQRVEQVRADEEVARRLAREEVARRLARDMGGPAADLAREHRELPPALQIDPLAAVGTLGLGLRNGIRQLAANYVAPERGAPHYQEAEAEAANAQHEQGRQTAGGLLNAGPGLGLGLARVSGGAGGGAGGAAAFYAAAAARPGPGVQIFIEQDRPGAPAPPPPSPSPPPPPHPGLQRQAVQARAVPRVPPRSNFLTESQQAHVERYLSELDLEGAEPGVETPFQQQPAADNPAAAVVAAQTRRPSVERVARRTEQASHRTKGSDVAGRAGLGLAGLAGIGLRALDATGVQQLVVGGGVGDTRVRALQGVW